MNRNLEVRYLAEKLLYDLTQLPGESSDDQKRLGRALTRFLTSPHLTTDALFDDLTDSEAQRIADDFGVPVDYTPYQVEEKRGR